MKPTNDRAVQVLCQRVGELRGEVAELKARLDRYAGVIRTLVNAGPTE